MKEGKGTGTGAYNSVSVHITIPKCKGTQKDREKIKKATERTERENRQAEHTKGRKNRESGEKELT
jgi:hypothetical protein